MAGNEKRKYGHAEGDEVSIFFAAMHQSDNEHQTHGFNKVDWQTDQMRNRWHEINKSQGADIDQDAYDGSFLNQWV